MTLRWRLTFLYMGATVLMVLAAGFGAYGAYRLGSISMADRGVMQAMDDVVDLVASLKPFRPDVGRQLIMAFAEGHQNLFLNTFVAPHGPLFQSDTSDAFPKIEDLPRSPSSGRVRFTTISIPKRGERRVGSMFLPKAGEDGLWIQIGVPLPEIFMLWRGWQAKGIVFFFALMAIGFGTAGWWVAGRALAPVKDIAHVAESVSQGSLHERIPTYGKRDELGRLVDVLNTMLGRLESSTRNLHQFASNISHQLKTPLTILRGEIEVALDGHPSQEEMRSILESNLAEVEALSALVEDLLAFARMEDETNVVATPQRVDLLLQDIGRKAAILARRKSQRVEVSAPQAVTALAQPVRLAQAVLNIIENAIRHTPEEGLITLSVTEEPGAVSVQVEDSGPGISEAALQNIFRRGWSRTGTGQGTGIGLGLAKSLVESFSGTLDVLSTPGKGLRVLIRMEKELQLR